MAAIQEATTGKAALKSMIGLVWVCRRAVDPGFTLDDARKVKLSELDIEIAEPDPTPGSG